MAVESVASTQKTCRECGNTKHAEAFQKNRRICRACRSSYTHAWKQGFRKGPMHPTIKNTHKVCSKCATLKPIEAYRMIQGTARRPEARRAECKACAADYDHAYHAANPEIRRALWDTYYDTHHDDMLSRAQIYYYDNQAERMRYHRAWTKAHPEKANAHGRKRKTIKHGLPSTLTHEEETFCRQYFHYACALCGNEEGFQWTIAMDHWIPLTSPDCPGTIATNMIPLCHGIGGCNNKKGRKDPLQWLLAHVGPQKAAHIHRRIDVYFAAVRARFPSTDSSQRGAR